MHPHAYLLENIHFVYRMPRMLAAKLFVLVLLASCSDAYTKNTFLSFIAKNFIEKQVDTFFNNLDKNNTCVQYFFRLGLAAQRKEIWALRVLDSYSKINSGYFDGNLFNPGYFDECVDTNNVANDFRGKYCIYVVSVAIPEASEPLNAFLESHPRLQENKFIAKMPLLSNKIPIGAAACVPDVCTADDLTMIYNATEVEKKFNNISLTFDDELCQVKTYWFQNWTAWKWSGLGFFIISTMIVIFSSLYDFYLHAHDKRPLHEILVIYSIRRNLKDLTYIKNDVSETIGCIQGLRVFSIAWVILGHRYLMAAFHPNINELYVLKTWKERDESALLTGAHLSVDTFFFISGFLIFYLFFVFRAKGGRFNIFGYLISRYVRLTPAIIAMIILSTTFFEDLGSGPYWNLATPLISNPCRTGWWKTLLYFQNYINSTEICVGQTWYTAADTQLYVIAPIFFLAMTRWPKIVQCVMVLATLGCCVWSFWEAWSTHAMANLEGAYNVWNLYSQTQFRAHVWLMGAILGYRLYLNRGRKVIISRWVYLPTWAFFVFLMGFCVYSCTYFLWRLPYDRTGHAFAFGFGRPIWAAGLTWVVYACHTGYGGWINSFLSSKPFVILGRLTYSMFATHFIVLVLYFGTVQMNGYFSDWRNLHAFWGDFVSVTVISLYWYLTFEKPFINLMSIIVPKDLILKPTRNNIISGTNGAA